MPSAATIEQQRQTRIDAGTKKLREMFDAAFTPDYYKKNIEAPARTLYGDDLNNQYRNSLSQLKFALGRTGNSNSSVNDQRMGELTKQFYAGHDTMLGRVQDLVNARKQNVANAESVAQSQLLSSANPEAAAAQGANLIDANSKQGSFSPLGQVFTDFTAGLATQADLERTGRNRYDLGVSNWGNNLKRYTQNVFG